MKKLVILPLLLLPLALSSCDSFNAEIYQVNNYEFSVSNDSNYIKDVDAEQLISLFEGKRSFPLYFYSENCSTCAEVSSYIKSYVRLYKTTIYGYNFLENRENYESLNNYDPELFPQKVITPRFLLIKNGTLSLEVNSSKFASFQSFEKTLKAFLCPANIYTLNTFNAFTKFDEQFSNYICFVYDRRIVEQNKLINQFIYPNIGAANKTILLLDVCDIDVENLTKMSNYLSVEIKNHLLVVDNDNLDYADYSIDMIRFDELLRGYFGA